MKGRNYIILIAWAALAVIAAGCSTQPEPHIHTHTHSEDSHSKEESLEYLRENHPTRDQMIQARECATARTGYEFDPLPDDFGPGRVGTPAPRTGRKVPNEVNDIFHECVFDLGLEAKFHPPWNHEALRAYIAWRAERNR